MFFSLILAICFLANFSISEAINKHTQHHKKQSFPKGWKNPKIKLSPPPKLMGKQMGQVNTIGLQPLGYELKDGVKEFTLIAQPVEKLLTDSRVPSWEHLVPKQFRTLDILHTHNLHQKLKCWGYNGSMPGPTIEVTEGDRVRIHVKNELPEPTSVHWHGIEVPNSQDGAAGETQAPIMPGETYTYEFTLYQSGTFMYHSGFNIMKQDEMGLVGLFVVHPKKPEHKIDKDFAIFLQQWKILPGSEYPNIVSMDTNWATFNGLAAPNVPQLTVNQGERVRIRFGNISLQSHPIHIHGYTWEEVGTDGGPIPKTARRKGATINVPPGSTRDVEFVAWNPGLWRLHCHILHHVVNGHADVPMGLMAHGGMFTMVYVIPKEPNEPWHHPAEQSQEKTPEKQPTLCQEDFS